jgi:SAM-dependent methyltransferase
MAENGQQVTTTVCPLCGGQDFRPSWVGVVAFKGLDFTFMECIGCRSFICDPMPDESTLLDMYGNSYFDGGSCTGEDSSMGKFADVLEYLRVQEPGVFIDYGCGDGHLLAAAAELGWKPIGIEFNPEHVNDLKQRWPFEIIGHRDVPGEKADVLHLGDVIEHLTEMDDQFPKILSLLKENGVLIAHGPLEANPSFFNFVMSVSRRLRRSKITNVAPYHVILATSNGQRQLFERHGLEEECFRVQEVAFPAPDGISLKDLADFRKTLLFAIRKVSQAFTAVLGTEARGNRYFYVGRRPYGKDNG